MTEENYNYRTSPMFLRNQFKGEGKWNIPVIPKADLGLTPFDDQRLIGFDKIVTAKENGDKYSKRIAFELAVKGKVQETFLKLYQSAVELVTGRQVTYPH